MVTVMVTGAVPVCALCLTGQEAVKRLAAGLQSKDSLPLRWRRCIPFSSALLPVARYRRRA